MRRARLFSSLWRPHRWSPALSSALLTRCRPMSSIEGAVDEALEMRRVILTFSGKVELSDGSEIWSRIANVMKAAGANIETASGTFVQLLPVEEDENGGPSCFSVSAFGACISPSQQGEIGRKEGSAGDSSEQLLGCSMYVKALLPEGQVANMMQLLQRQSPLQVYTVSLSSDAAQALPDRPHWMPTQQDADPRQTGTVYLFGVDRAGQLARITETLREFKVIIMHLRVQTGFVDADKLDFVPAMHDGALAENRLRVTLPCDADLAHLREEIARVGQEVGYAVTCLTTDSQSRLRAQVPSYMLRRKAFSIAFLAEAAAMAGRSMHRRPVEPMSLSGVRLRKLPKTEPWVIEGV